jgi:hypothetical protein
MEGLGGGIAAFAFWGFIASVVVAGIWYAAREREAQHETLRRFVESGKPIDDALMDKVLGGDKNVARDLRIGGLITLFTAPGLAILGWFISQLAEAALMPLLGTAGLVACVGVGLLVASKAADSGGDGGSSVNGNMAP